MAEYIDREKLIERLHNAEENYKADHDYEIDDPFSDGVQSAMFSVNQIIGTESSADVVEREKIDRVIDDIENIALIVHDRINHYYKSGEEIKAEVLEIFKRNIGE